MADSISAMINLINALTTNSQDDTDPNNVVVQKFISPQDSLTYVEQNFTQVWAPPEPTESSSYAEKITTTRWGTVYKWAGDGPAPTFMWNQGGLYS